MDMGIVNPAQLVIYDDIDKKLLECAWPAFRKANTTPGYHYWLIN